MRRDVVPGQCHHVMTQGSVWCFFVVWVFWRDSLFAEGSLPVELRPLSIRMFLERRRSRGNGCGSHREWTSW